MDEQALRQAFAAVLPDRIVGLEMAYEGWRLSQPDAIQALEEFNRLAHNLAGAAALYGFEQVSVPCRALECYLRDLMRHSEFAEVRDYEAAARLLASIRGIAREIERENVQQAVNPRKQD